MTPGTGLWWECPSDNFADNSILCRMSRGPCEFNAYCELVLLPGRTVPPINSKLTMLQHWASCTGQGTATMCRVS